MKNEALITVVDENPVNQTALRILIASLHFHDINTPIFVLCPKNILSPKIKKWFFQKNARLVPFDFRHDHDDPYFAKFLIRYFFTSQSLDYTNYCYVDPDHIFLDRIALPHSQSGTLFISSENAEVVNIQNFSTQYYNTSVIYGMADTFVAAVENWLDEYEVIKKTVGYRHREEIAFSLSCQKKNISLQPVEKKCQGSFKYSHQKSAMFHYGGESQKSMLMKNILLNGLQSVNIKSVLKNFTRPSERSVFQAFVNLLEMDTKWQN